MPDYSDQELLTATREQIAAVKRDCVTLKVRVDAGVEPQSAARLAELEASLDTLVKQESALSKKAGK